MPRLARRWVGHRAATKPASLISCAMCNTPSKLVTSALPPASGEVDPRREFAETLIEAISRTAGPIVVYSPFEATVLRALAAVLPDLSGRLFAAIDRMADLLPIIRSHVTHPEFLGSNSIKVVAPALVPGFSYDDLDGIADGNDASAMFYRIASDRSLSKEDRMRSRQALLAYYCRDTQALMYVHRRLSQYSCREAY